MNIRAFSSRTGLRRIGFATAALAVSTAAIIPALSGHVSAAQVTSRYIKLSNSEGAATGVSYEVGFVVPTNGAVEGVVVDFCSASPLPGTACTKPAGFNLTATPTVDTTTAPNTGLGAGWTAAGINNATGYRTLTLKNASGPTLNGTTVKFTISGVTNPTADNAAFYARILTFAVDTDIDTWDNTADGSSLTGVVDSGGAALSTAASIDVTAKVQEQLTFCVYTSGATATDCAGATGSTASLGDTNGVLTTSGVYLDKSVKYNVSTNASGNAMVRLKGDIPRSGSNSITAIGGTAAASNPGNTQFGVCSYSSGGAGGLTIQSPYTGGAGTECQTTTQSAGTGSPGGAGSATFAFDTNTTDGTMSTYGDDLAVKTAGNMTQGTLVMIGNVAPTQAAGIYDTTLYFIATGTY